jgi:N-acetylglutamate synthase/N-acetylornithine aminotransferase
MNKTREYELKELREQIARDIENAVIEVAGDSAHTMEQAARIARGVK